MIVVVARDETVQDVKGHVPLQSEQVRLEAVAHHPLVSEARLGLPGDKYRIIEEIRPDIILLGYDQQAFTGSLEEALRVRGISSLVKRAHSYKPEIYKSSLLNI